MLLNYTKRQSELLLPYADIPGNFVECLWLDILYVIDRRIT